jgi:gas vesicle protein
MAVIGRPTTLSDLRDKLEESDSRQDKLVELQEETSVGIRKLVGFAKPKLDDLEKQREERDNVVTAVKADAPVAVQKETGLFGNLLDFLGIKEIGDMGKSALAGIGGLLGLNVLKNLFTGNANVKSKRPGIGGLLKRGLIGGLLITLADEVANQVETYTGSKLAGDVSGYAMTGAGLGSLFGPAGMIAGAFIGAVNRYSEEVGKQVAAAYDDKDMNELAGETVRSGLNIGAATAGGFLVGGPAGAIVAFLGSAGLETARLLKKYETDPEFKREVDLLGERISASITSIIEQSKSYLDKIFDPLITTTEEMSAYRTANPEQAAREDTVQSEINALAKKALTDRENFSDEDRQRLEKLKPELDELRKFRQNFMAAENRKERGPIPFMPDESSSDFDGTEMKEAAEKTAQVTADKISDFLTERAKIAEYGRMQNMTSSYLSPEVQEKQLRAQLGKDYEGLKARADQMGMSLQEFTSKIGTNLERINQDISNALKAGAPSASSGGAPVNVTDASDKSVRTTNASAYAGSPSLNTNDTEAVIF